MATEGREKGKGTKGSVEKGGKKGQKTVEDGRGGDERENERKLKGELEKGEKRSESYRERWKSERKGQKRKVIGEDEREKDRKRRRVLEK